MQKWIYVRVYFKFFVLFCQSLFQKFRDNDDGFLVAAIITFLEFIAYKKSESFVGYLVYIVLMVVGIIIVIALTKALFTFLGNPSMLFEK